MCTNPTIIQTDRYTLRLSARGTARIAWSDGYSVTICNQPSATAAFKEAWRIRQRETASAVMVKA